MDRGFELVKCFQPGACSTDESCPNPRKKHIPVGTVIRITFNLFLSEVGSISQSACGHEHTNV